MRCHIFACPILILILVVSFATFVQADEILRFTIGSGVIHGGSPDHAKAGGDTINLMAARNDPTNGPGEPIYIGDFEDVNGNPAWNGWTHWDITQETETHWVVSNYNQPDPLNHAAWCGDINIAACDTNDLQGGYGNSWHDVLEFRRTVPHPGSSTTLNISAAMIYDTEPAYDYIYLSYRYHAQPYANLQIWDGSGSVTVNGSVTYISPEYIDGTDVALYFRFKSDGGWSDEDCSFPSVGACQVDDINVNLVNDIYSEDFFEDFENGADENDFGVWEVAFPPGVGDFSHIWSGLNDIDPCRTNHSPQVAFIDDGIVVPGTGGSECINWCYGPGGYIVNTTGGLAGPMDHLHIQIESPVMDWPAPSSGTGPDDDGIIFRFGVYRHEDLSSDAPGVFYTWGVRSADTDGSGGQGIQDITERGWQDRSFVIYGGPDYTRGGDDVTDLMNQGRDVVQVSLGVYELGWIWYWTGNDGYPAPYFDNVTVKIFPYAGPGMSARELDMAQDNFPERGSIDTGDLGSHSVRFDSANNISWAGHLRNDPGDSMVVDIVPVRVGAGFDGDPVMHYIVDRNPVFDASRGPQPAVGTSVAMPAVGSSGSPTPGKWAFDLPDTGFLYPGDVLHYYITATDAIGGVGGTDPQTSLMPADTTGFSTGFGDPMGYHPTFTVRALPGIRGDGFGGFEQPRILFINDFANRGGENEWYTAWNNLGCVVDEDYDVYYVNAPSSGVGNGIGGRANSILLEGYTEIFYTCGDLSVNTIANGDFNNDASDDVGTLTAWLDLGGRDMFLTGDDLVKDLAQAGSATMNFMETCMGVGLFSHDIRPLIGNQTTPMVGVMPFNPVFNGSLQSWITYGGCMGMNTFDAVEVKTGSVRLAEFFDPAGQAGAYTYSAATLTSSVGLMGTSRVISLPYDLMYIYTDPATAGNYLPGRARLLGDVLQYFGVAGGGDPSGTEELPGITFRTSHYPNPFNPSTTIKYSMPRAGHLKLSIYNVRGHLVKTLIDGHRPAGANQTIVWDGSDNLGSSAASGVYFYEAGALGDVRIGKMTLLK